MSKHHHPLRPCPVAGQVAAAVVIVELLAFGAMLRLVTRVVVRVVIEGAPGVVIETVDMPVESAPGSTF